MMAAREGEVLVVFCDVGPRFGIGHLMRCVALAEEVASRGGRVIFAADVASVPFAAAQVAARGFEHRAAPSGAAHHARLLQDVGATAAVVDSYHLPAEVYAAVADAVPTVALVDGDPGDRRAHLLVDQNIGAEDDVWPLPPGAARLAGLDYALMRAEIRDRRPPAPSATAAAPPRVFAFFGGTDAFGAGPVLTRTLVASGAPFDLRVVAPAPWEETVEPGPGQTITVVGPTDRLAEEVAAADLVVSAAGTSSWELLCLGAACAFVCVADNQEVSYGRAVAAGLGWGLGRLDDLAGPVPDPTAVDLLAGILTDPEGRARMRRTAWERVDGEGRARVWDAVTEIGRPVPRW